MSADAQLAETVGDAANPLNHVRSQANSGESWSLGVQGGQRVGNAELLQIITCAHLAAEAVAAVGDGHAADSVRVWPAPAPALGDPPG